MSRNTTRILIATIALAIALFVIASLFTTGQANWSGSTVVTIVVEATDLQGKPISACVVEPRQNADLFGDDGEVDWQGSTNEYGIATLTGEIGTHGVGSESFWRKKEALGIQKRGRIILCKCEGFETARVGLWEVTPEEYVNPTFPLVVPVQITTQKSADSVANDK